MKRQLPQATGITRIHMKIAGPFLISLLFIAGCSGRETPPAVEDITPVRVAPVVKKEISIPVLSSGILAPSEEIKLSFKTGGIIDRINAREGQRVKKGTLLASLDLSEINSSVNQARNGYEKALRDFNRAENLYRDSVATLEMRQNASTALEVAKSTLDMAEFNLRHSSIVAPSEGTILKQLAKQDELIATGYPVFLFGAAGESWKVKTGLSDRDVVKISLSDSAVIRFDAHPGVVFRAVVAEIGGMADPYTGTYETELMLEPSGYRLASGFVGSVEIFPATKRSFTVVPVASITEADGFKGYIYVVTDSSTVSKIRVNIEGMPGESAAITGIPENIREVVSEGAAYLKDGKKIRVIPQVINQ